MDQLQLSVILILLLFVILGSGVWISFALAAVGLIAVLTDRKSVV